MIAVGRDPMWTCPLAAVTVVGKLPAGLAAALAVLLVAWELPHAAHVAARAAAAMKAGRRRERTRMIILRRVVEDEVRPLRHRRGIETNRPSSEDSASAPARRPGSSPRRGITVAGQRRYLTGFAGSAPSWVDPGQPVPYRGRRGRDVSGRSRGLATVAAL